MADKKQRKTIVKVVVVVLLVLIIVGFLGLGCYALMTPSPVIDIPISKGVRGGVSERIDRFGTSYATPEEAFSERKEEVLGETAFVSDVLIELASSDELIRVYFTEQITDRGVRPCLRAVRFFKNDDNTWLIEKKAELWVEVYIENYWTKSYIYANEKERVAEHLNKAINHKAFLETDMPYLFLGVSENPNIESLTILGKHPTDVVEYEYEGVTYYIWYYDREDLDIAQHLADDPDFDFGDYTIRKMITSLDIEFEE